jgi:hypothetical protein
VIDRCLVNGQPRVFAQYLSQIGADTRWPMVANYFGTNINVSFQKVIPEEGRVQLYAPVFRHVAYRLAAPLAQTYEEAYTQAVQGREFPFACSCILNFIYGGLEGKTVHGAPGAVTFGEIAHQLLNQTTVYLELVAA